MAKQEEEENDKRRLLEQEKRKQRELQEKKEAREREEKRLKELQVKEEQKQKLLDGPEQLNKNIPITVSTEYYKIFISILVFGITQMTLKLNFKN